VAFKKCWVSLHSTQPTWLKSVESVSKAHKKQVLTYLKLTGKKLGYLLNFGEELMKDGISRILNGHVE